MTDMHSTPTLDNMQPVAIEEALTDSLAKAHRLYSAQYGVRRDDGALVFHFFGPGYVGETVKWVPAAWTTFRDALEQAILKCFASGEYQADYAEELQSFSLIVQSPAAPDLSGLTQHFFAVLDASLGSPA